MEKIKISITGLGWYGVPLGEELIKDGHTVLGTTKAPEKKTYLESKGFKVFQLSFPEIPTSCLEADIVILNIPPFEEELEWFKSWPWKLTTKLIFISSTSVTPAPDSRSGELLSEQENWVKSSFNQWTILRFGGLIGHERHPGKFLSGRKNLSGRNWPVNLIHLEDCIGVTKAIIEKNIWNRVVNAVADEHPTREEYYTRYCLQHGLPVPEFNPEDLSTGKLVNNSELKTFYLPKRSL